jgi:hypothetical protein
MEDVILLLVYILVGIIVTFVALAFLIRLLVSGQIWAILKFIIILCLVIYVYYKLGGYIYKFYLTWVPFKYVNKNMKAWDEVWYSLLIIFIITMCSVFIKSVKNNNINWQRLFTALAVLGTLGFYTIMYYLYFYYEYIGSITGYLTIAMIVATGLVIMMKHSGLSYGYTAPVFMLYALVGLTYMMACFLFFFYILNKCYDYVN